MNLKKWNKKVALGIVYESYCHKERMYFQLLLSQSYSKIPFKPFQPGVAFHMETCHLICSANQMSGFSMKCKTEL